MRAKTLCLAVTLVLLTASTASAAPVCENKYGDGARCGTPGAMPIGWALTPAQREYWRPDTPMAPAKLFGLISIVGGIFALIALMPDFDGRTGADWGKQEDDDQD